MKLLFSTKLGIHQWLLQAHHHNYCRLLTSLFSTNILPHSSLLSSSSSSSSSIHSLYNQLNTIRDPKHSTLPVLERWLKDNGTLESQQLRQLVRIMKDFRRYHQALEISHWMTDRLYVPLSAVDAAVRLGLVYKVYGIEHAENFFNSVSNSLKNYNVYGALLSCYVQEKSVEKAEYLMEEMRTMGLVKSSFSYNLLMNLYSKTGKYDKIDMLLREMETKGIPQDKYTMNNRMAAAVAASDISEMESILNHMEESPNVVVNWKIYSIAATGYLNVKMTDKALVMLKKMETMMPRQQRKVIFEFLLTLYAKANNKDELYRVWNSYKPSDGPLESAYCHMITALAKLGDLDGAERIFEEWESRCTWYDFRVLNRLLVAYCEEGLLDKAESVVNKAVEGRTPYASTWNVLAMGFLEHNRMPKAVEMLKKAMLVGRRGWRPNSTAFNACLGHLEEQGDVKGVEEMMYLFKKSGPLTRDIYHRLLRCRIRAGESVSDVVDQMKADGFDVDEETRKIIGYSNSGASVC